MSSSATFWAAKATDLKSSQAPTHVADPVTAHITPKKTGMVLERTTNGVKKTSWADSDDEDDFVTSFTLSRRVAEIEKILSAKDSRITDLTTAMHEKDTRIIELESALDKQTQSFANLHATIDASTTQIAELEEENRKQSLNVQKLVAEVGQKVRHIASLETEVNEHCAIIAELDMGDSSTQVSSHDTLSPTDVAAPSASTPAEIEAQHKAIEPSKEVESAAQTTIKTTPDNKNTLINPFTEGISIKADGPAVNLSAFPVFATSTTVKHTAPPPPAPKLKMPVDLSKFAKKSVAKSVEPKKKVEAASDEVAKDGPAPNIDPTSDIRTKPREERVLFANGPKVQVQMGDIGLSILPKYVLMQCSHKAFKHFTDNPDATTFVLPAGSMDEAAAKTQLEWMKEMTYQGRVYSITLHSDEKFDDKNLQICRAARVLGLNNMYVGHFTKVFCNRVRSNTASQEFLYKIVALAYPENDPLYDCLANNLANLRTRNAVNNPAELEAFLDKFPGLHASVAKIEKRMRKKQEGTEALVGPKVVYVGKKM